MEVRVLSRAPKLQNKSMAISMEMPAQGNESERIFQPREVVRVERSNGDMEDGWTVLTIDGDRVRVISGQGVVKNPTITDLRKWNQ